MALQLEVYSSSSIESKQSSRFQDFGSEAKAVLGFSLPMLSEFWPAVYVGALRYSEKQQNDHQNGRRE